MGVTHAALLDELQKIGEAEKKTLAKKPHWSKEVGKGILVSGAGAGLGYGAGMLLEQALPGLKTPQANKARLYKNLVLPILTGAGFYLGDRYRRKMNELKEKAPGYQQNAS